MTQTRIWVHRKNLDGYERINNYSEKDLGHQGNVSAVDCNNSVKEAQLTGVTSCAVESDVPGT